jgi:hypothetical protein
MHLIGTTHKLQNSIPHVTHLLGKKSSTTVSSVNLMLYDMLEQTFATSHGPTLPVVKLHQSISNCVAHRKRSHGSMLKSDGCGLLFDMKLLTMRRLFLSFLHRIRH